MQALYARALPDPLENQSRLNNQPIRERGRVLYFQLQNSTITFAFWQLFAFASLFSTEHSLCQLVMTLVHKTGRFRWSSVPQLERKRRFLAVFVRRSASRDYICWVVFCSHFAYLKMEIVINQNQTKPKTKDTTKEMTALRQ